MDLGGALFGFGFIFWALFQQLAFGIWIVRVTNYLRFGY